MTHAHSILLVDDDPKVIKGLSRQLHQEPYQIFTALSANEALKILREQQIDLILSDEKMPLITGSELVSTVRCLYPNIICLMLSGEKNFEAVVKSLNEGEIFRFLKKPCDSLELITQIRLALEQRFFLLQSREKLDPHQKELQLIKQLKKEHPDLFEGHYDERGNLIID